MLAAFFAIVGDISVRADEKHDRLFELYVKSQGERAASVYRRPAMEELSEFHAVFDAFIEMHESRKFEMVDELNTRAGKMGFEILRLQSDPARGYTILREVEGFEGGGGIYILTDCLRSTRPMILQCPHAQSDLNTGKIGILALQKTQASAFFSSTVRRDASVQNPTLNSTDPDNSADLAHSKDTFFQVATAAYCQVHPDLLLLQVHGFDSAKNTPSSRSFSIILSPGKKQTRSASFYEKCIEIFKNALPARDIADAGTKTKELEATTNVQGKFVRSHGAGEFLHIEISDSYRKELILSSKSQEEFFGCLNQIMAAYEKH
jgi:hypothetical protein